MTRLSLADAVRAILETEPLEKAAAKLGVSRDDLAQVLREGAGIATFKAPKPVQERLFAAPAEPKALPEAEPARRATLYTDGASRGNPGLAGAGAVLVLPGQPAVRLKRFLGVQTNNVAEYEGVLLGMEKALELGVRELDVKADSMLAMMQLKGEWKLKNEGLRPLWERARELARKFERVAYTHIPREQNSDADEMSNRAIDERE